MGFGELALSKKGDKKRQATIICKGELHMAILDREAFQKST